MTWEESGSHLFMEPLIPDSFVIVGRSKAVGQSKADGGCREHVVPRLAICINCHEMFAIGKSIEAVAAFIRKFLKIVLVTKDEQVKINMKANNHNNRDYMPVGWPGCAR